MKKRTEISEEKVVEIQTKHKPIFIGSKTSTAGITLIAIVITIIVLLILAAVSIATLTGENGILAQASTAKDKTEIGRLKESIEIELPLIQFDQNGKFKNLTVSEIVDELKKNGILNNDMTFCSNENYNLTYAGYIIYNGEKVANVKLSDNYTTERIPISNESTALIGDIEIRCFDGRIDIKEDVGTKLEANQPPSGKKFAYWVDEYNNVIEYNSCIGRHLELIDDRIFIPIYINQDEEIDTNRKVAIYGSNKTQDGFLVFTACIYGDSSMKSIHLGTLATSNPNLANTNDLEINTTNSQIYYRGGDYFSQLENINTFVWTKSNVGTDKWYCRGYATITYNDGRVETIYSKDIISKSK